MKPCLDPPPNAQMAEGKNKIKNTKNLRAASFSYCHPGKSSCVSCTQTQVFHTSFLELTLHDVDELVNIWVSALERASYPNTHKPFRAHPDL